MPNTLTLPAFVYLMTMIVFFRIGMMPGLIATFVFVLPSIRLMNKLFSALDPLIRARRQDGLLDLRGILSTLLNLRS